MGARREARDRKRRLVTAAILRALETTPLDILSIRKVAEEAGLTYWAVRRSFSSVERQAAIALAAEMSDLVADLDPTTQASDSVFATVRAYAEAVIDLLQGTRYRRLMHIILRDGKTHRWMHDLYRDKLARHIGDGLVKGIRDAGCRYGAVLSVRETIPFLFLRKLESQFVLLQLLPGGPELPQAERQRLVGELAAEVISQTFDWNLTSAADHRRIPSSAGMSLGKLHPLGA